MPGLHFHDLRHVGGTLAAATGASLKELMARLGHSSTRAAMTYQQATRDRDRAIARALAAWCSRSGPPLRTVRKRPAEMRNSRLLWPVCGLAGPSEPWLIKETPCSGPVTWAYVLERAKGIEPS
jgi:hypothetical protein